MKRSRRDWDSVAEEVIGFVRDSENGRTYTEMLEFVCMLEGKTYDHHKDRWMLGPVMRRVGNELFVSLSGKYCLHGTHVELVTVVNMDYLPRG